jgi:ribonucleoside-diphosphate reductase alpha chain
VTHKFRVGEQEGYVTVGLYEEGVPGEIFVNISKEGSTIRGLMDSVAVLTSVALQYGVPLENLVAKFRGVHFEPAGLTNNPRIPTATSLVDYIFRWLELRFLKPEGDIPPKDAPRPTKPASRTRTSPPTSRTGATRGRAKPAPAATRQRTTARSRSHPRPAPARRSQASNLQPPTSGGTTTGRRTSTSQRPVSSDRAPNTRPPDVSTGIGCPECGSVLVFAEGCITCRNCGYTRC